MQLKGGPAKWLCACAAELQISGMVDPQLDRNLAQAVQDLIAALVRHAEAEGVEAKQVNGLDGRVR